MSNSFDKLSVLDSFIEEVNSYLPEIEANLERLAQSSSGGAPIDMEAVEETYRRTHTIGGSSFINGFPGVSPVAPGLEELPGGCFVWFDLLGHPTPRLFPRSFAHRHHLLLGV